MVLDCVVYVLYYTTQPKRAYQFNKEELQPNTKGCEDWRRRGFWFFLFYVLLYDGLSRGARALFVFVLRCKTYFFYFLYVFCFVLFCFFLFFLCFFVFFGVFWWFFDTFFDFCFTGFELVFLMFFGAFLILFLILAWFIPFFDYNRITIRRAKTFCQWCVLYDKKRIE